MNHRPEPTPDPDDEDIARVREVRHRISERFGHDPYRLVAHYIERQQQREHPSVRAAEPGAAGETSGPTAAVAPRKPA
ncbi:MAG TPA: hypothetical protein VHB47_12115 [Thermoanaerobaculia bacterium]|jgi:hypothetical protein|nr:hypothetical protein [Thermoanaerobaculia bacterium]